ncbi:MAG: MFS transporter [Nitrososphaerales archaeon]
MEYKYVVLINTTVGGFMALLDSNIVLISLPNIIRSLPDTPTSDAIWIVMGYTLILATLLLSIGRLADINGRVRLYNLGFAIFTIGSGLCSLSFNGASLVLFRLVQGVGGALLTANSPAILTDAFPLNERGRAIGINQIGGVTGSVSGLVAGGILTQLLGWRSIFWVNLPVGIFATIWAYARLKELSKRLSGERVDIIGMGLFGIGLTLFLLGLTFGSVSAWSPTNIALMVVGLATLGAFVLAESKIKYPMMDLSLFKVRAFSAGILSNLLVSISRGSLSLVLVFYFQGALLLDALTAGILLVPFSIAFVIIGPISGYLSDKYGARGFSTGGLLLTAAAFAIFAVLPANVSYDIFLIPMILAGVGGGMFFAPNVASIMNSAPMSRRGIASGMSSMLLNTGFLLSIGISFAIMASSMPLSTLDAIFAGLPVPNGGVNLTVFMSAMHKIFIIMAIVSLVAAIPSSLRGQSGSSSRKSSS